MKRIPLLCTLITAMALGACGAQSPSALEDAALHTDTFTIADVHGASVDHAYVFCEYTSKETAAQLGFDPADFFDVDDQYRKWETYTGIGVTYSDGTAPTVEWFDPYTVDACPDYYNSGQEIDPHATIAVKREDVSFTDGSTSEVALLSYR